MSPSSLPPLRILHLASSERWTGVAEPLVSLAMQQEKMGHKTWVGCVPGGTFEDVAREHGARMVERLSLNRRLHPLQFFSDLRRIPRFCREKNIDVVHCHLLHDHWMASWALKGLWPKPGTGKRPLIFRTNHASGAPRNDWPHRRLFLKYTDQLICISRHAAERTETALGLDAGAIPHVSGAVDLARFHPDLDRQALRSEWGVPPEAPLIGIVTRVKAGRGVRWLMRAVPRVLERVPDARIVIVGRGELKKWFRKEIKNPVYAQRVINGKYRGPDLPEAYAAMDATLFLGLGSEGTCRAIIEAMACARPTIGTTLGAVPEIIEDGRTGLLARDRSMESLADCIVELLSDRDRCAALGRAAREAAEKRFSEAARAEAFMEIYARALERSPEA
jgi:glycosyltransferase involved in cell wall biosynthesis